MAISFNTAASANGAGASITSLNLTIPAGVLAHDRMLLVIEGFDNGASGSVTVSATSTGTAFTQIGPQQVGGAGASGFNSFGAIFEVRDASASDAGKVITAHINNGGGSDFLAMSMAAYTGASNTAPVDVSGGTNSASSPLTFPAETTTVAGDWAVYLAAFGESTNATFTGPSGTSRTTTENGGVGSGIWDSNGSFAAGTVIGGAGETFSSTSATVWLDGWTVGLPVPAQPEAPTVLPQQIPYPLWPELLEVAAERSGWQQQGVPSLQQQHWRLMDGVNGRPGTGSSGTQPPATATGSGTNCNGTSFYVSQGGMWLEGYWWFVCAAGGQSVSPQKFALWSCINGGGAVVPGSVVTSGTLSAGWNYIPLPQPVQLALWGQYTAATGLTGTFPQTTAQFSSGGPYQGGIRNTPLYAFSDNNGTNPAPYSFGNGATIATSSTDPSLPANQPSNDANAGTNFWLDVQVTNTAPPGYSGSYRLYPNQADADSNAALDAAVNYVIGTEVILSQPCVANAVWYYRPAGTAQFATSADIWRVRDGVRVATQPSPVWTLAGGGVAPVSGAAWVRCEMPGVTLPAGDYYVTVYDGAGTPDQWSVKSLGWWQALAAASQGRGSPDGTFLHSPPGVSGITNGPLYAPTTPLASPIQDYGNPAVTEPGQCVFATGPPNQFPNRYVGQSGSGGTYTGPALFQQYYVDLEATPASSFTPDAPDLPQRLPHPLYTRLLGVAAERADWSGPASPAPVAPLATPPRIPHPLWDKLLEVAWQRADWQAQGVVSAAVSGPPVYPLHGPVQARQPLPPRGRTASRAGVFAQAGPPVYPPHGPVRGQPATPLLTGRARSRSGTFGGTGAPAIPLRRPVGLGRQQLALPPRGRTASQRGPYGQTGPPAIPLRHPVSGQPQKPLLTGRTASRAGPFVFIPPPPLQNATTAASVGEVTTTAATVSEVTTTRATVSELASTTASSGR